MLKEIQHCIMGGKMSTIVSKVREHSHFIWYLLLRSPPLFNINIISDNESVKRVIRRIVKFRKKISCRINSQLTFPRSSNQLLAELKIEAKSNSHSYCQMGARPLSVLGSTSPLTAIMCNGLFPWGSESLQVLV